VWDEVMKILKDLSGTMSSITIIAAFLIATIKPVRKSFVAWVRKQTSTEDICGRLKNIETSMDDIHAQIGEMRKQLDIHVEQNNADFEKSREVQMLSLRCQIREIYTKNYPRKELTIREQRDLHDFFAAYRELGGNSYI
jgi:regulator of replication initiation timing